MPRSHFPNGFRNGVVIQNVPVLNTHGGNVFWVDSGSGSDSYKGTFEHPFGTIDYAVGRCSANNGDIILVKPGHSETITAAAGIDLDVAGITIVGLGSGSDRPTINYTTATAADMDVDAANITIQNLYFDLTGIDAVTAAIDVNAADFTMDGCEVLMADSGGQATECIVTATAADRMRVIDCIFRSPNAGANNAISIEGTPDGIEIVNTRIYGDFADACIHNPTGNVATNLLIDRCILQNDQTGDHALELVSAVTGVIRDTVLITDAIATGADLGSLKSIGVMFYDSSDADAAGTPYPETITTGGHSLSQIADRLGADADTDAIAAALYGTAGIATFPAAAAAANAVSIAEVLRYVSDLQLPKVAVATKADVTATTAWTTGNSPITLFTVTGAVLVQIMAVVTTNMTSTLNNGTLEIGVAGNTAELAVQDAVDGTAFQAGDCWTKDTAADAPGAEIADEWEFLGNGDDIILTIATNDMTAGGMTVYCRYIPLTSGASVVAAF